MIHPFPPGTHPVLRTYAPLARSAITVDLMDEIPVAASARQVLERLTAASKQGRCHRPQRRPSRERGKHTSKGDPNERTFRRRNVRW